MSMRHLGAMYDNVESDVMYTYTCLIGELCYKKNGTTLCIITMYNVFELWNLMHVTCRKPKILPQYILYRHIHQNTMCSPFHLLVSGSMSMR